MYEEPTKLLKRAVSEITFNMNVNSLSPHDAVVKVAKDLDLNTNFIKRASEAINVALTHHHFKKHADSRDEDFPIVDADQVVKEVFSTSEKTANEKKSEWFPSVDVNDEVPNFNKILLSPAVKKAYESIVLNPENYETYDVSERGKMDKIAKVQDRMEKDLNDIATKRAGAKYDLNHNFATLVDRFSRDEAYRSSFSEFEKQSFSTYGARAVPYLDLVYKSAGIKEDRGDHDPKYASFHPSVETNLLGNILKSASELVDIEKVHADKTLTYLHLRQNVKQAYQSMYKESAVLADAVPPVVTNDPEEEDKVEKEEDPEADPVMKAAMDKVAAFKAELGEEETILTPSQRSLLPTALKREIIRAKKAGDEAPLNRLKAAADSIGSMVSNYVTEKYKQESTPRMTVPSTSHHDNVDRKLLLERMMVTDPILSNADPKRVVDAYEQFLHLSPELSKEPEVVKGALRNMVASQSLDPHTAQQFVEANSSFANQKLQQQHQAAPKGSSKH